MIVFDEIEYGTNIYSNKKQVTSIKASDLIILVRYYEHMKSDPFLSKKLNKKESSNKFLMRYCQKRIIDFNPIINEKFINKCVNYAKKSSIKLNNKIKFSKLELDTINNIDNEEIKKLMFVIMSVSKFYENNNTTKKKPQETNDILDKPKSTRMFLRKVSYKDLFKLSKIKYNIDSKNKYLYFLNQNGYIDTKTNGSMEILIGDKSDEIGIEFRCYEDMVYEFEYYFSFNEKLKRCEVCNILIETKLRSPQKYCKKCYNAMHKELNKEYMKKYRKIKQVD